MRRAISILSPALWNIPGYHSVWWYIDAVLDALSQDQPSLCEPACRLSRYDPAAYETVRPLRIRKRLKPTIDSTAIDVKRSIHYFEGSAGPYYYHYDELIPGDVEVPTLTAAATWTASDADRSPCVCEQVYGRYCLVTAR